MGDPAAGLPIGPSRQNLAAAVAGETHKYTDLYFGIAKSAHNEGLDETGEWFETVSEPVRSHANRHQRALDALVDRRARVSPPAKGLLPRVHRTEEDGDGAPLRHTPRMPALREPVRFVSGAVRSGRCDRLRRGGRGRVAALPERRRLVVPVQPVLTNEMTLGATAPLDAARRAPGAARKGVQIQER